MADMVAKGKWEQYNPGVPPPPPLAQLEGVAAPPPAPPTEEEEKTAAEALQSMSTSLNSSSVRGDGAPLAAHSSGRHGGAHQGVGKAAEAEVGSPPGRGTPASQLQRCGSELKRKGALDMMVAAADMNAGGTPE
jgi:hypothetical protein